MALSNVIIGGSPSVSTIFTGQNCIVKAFSNVVSTVFKFRFYLELVYDGKTYAYTFREDSGVGVLNITSILQSIIEPRTVTTGTNLLFQNVSPQLQIYNDNIHAMPYPRLNPNSGAIVLGSFSGGQAKKIVAKLYEFYSTTATGNPQKQGSSTDGAIYVLYGYPPANIDLQRKTTNVVVNYPTGRPNRTKNYWDLNQYIPDDEGLSATENVQRYFLSPINIDMTEHSNSQYTHQKVINVYAEPDDFGLIAFFNCPEWGGQGLAAANRLFVKYYAFEDGDIQLEGTESFPFTPTRGITAPNANGISGDDQICYFGAYPANLDKMNTVMSGTGQTFGSPATLTSVNFYDVYLGRTQDMSLISTMIYRFHISNGRFADADINEPWQHPKCKKYEKQRFAYINKLGVWEYINFRSKREDRISKETTEQKVSVIKYHGLFNSADQRAIFNSAVGNEGRKIVTQKFNNKFSVHTGYLDEYQIEAVRDMFRSSKIHILDERGNARAVIMTTKSLEDVVVSHKYDQVEYKLDFEYAIPTDGSINV